MEISFVSCCHDCLVDVVIAKAIANNHQPRAARQVLSELLMIPREQWILVYFDCLIPAHDEEPRLAAASTNPIGRAVKFVIGLRARLLFEIRGVIGRLSARRGRVGIALGTRVERPNARSLRAARNVSVEIVPL